MTKVDQALCLTLVTNACVLWTTTYLGDTIDALRGEGFEISDELAGHLTPAQHDHINFYLDNSSATSHHVARAFPTNAEVGATMMSCALSRSATAALSGRFGCSTRTVGRSR